MTTDPTTTAVAAGATKQSASPRKVVVLCFSRIGPTFFTCEVRCTDEEVFQGDHYDKAKTQAEAQGYEEPMLAFDATDPAASQVDQVQAWLRGGV